MQAEANWPKLHEAEIGSAGFRPTGEAVGSAGVETRRARGVAGGRGGLRAIIVAVAGLGATRGVGGLVVA